MLRALLPRSPRVSRTQARVSAISRSLPATSSLSVPRPGSCWAPAPSCSAPFPACLPLTVRAPRHPISVSPCLSVSGSPRLWGSTPPCFYVWGSPPLSRCLCLPISASLFPSQHPASVSRGPFDLALPLAPPWPHRSLIDRWRAQGLRGRPGQWAWQGPGWTAGQTDKHPAPPPPWLRRRSGCKPAPPHQSTRGGWGLRASFNF